MLECSDERDYVSEMALIVEHPLILTSIYDQGDAYVSDVIAPEVVALLLQSDRPTEVELGFELLAARAHIGAGHFVAEDETLVNVYNVEEDTITVKAVKSNLEMTKDEIRENDAELSKTKLKELKALHDLVCFKRLPRAKARNPVDTRWVHTWKLGEDHIRFIKSRITMRGFKDRCEWMETFAGTASRWA